MTGQSRMVGSLSLTPQAHLTAWRWGGDRADSGQAAWLRLEPTGLVVQPAAGEPWTLTLDDPTRSTLRVLTALALLPTILALLVGRWRRHHA